MTAVELGLGFVAALGVVSLSFFKAISVVYAAEDIGLEKKVFFRNDTDNSFVVIDDRNSGDGMKVKDVGHLF